MAEVCDVVIIGAGPAGSALAFFLASNGLDVLLIDKSKFPRDKTCGDALSPRALRVLQKIGLFEAVSNVGFAIRNFAFFAPNGDHITVPVPTYDGLPSSSIILPRYEFDNMLLERAIVAGARFRSQATATHVLRQDNMIAGVSVNTAEGPIQIRAKCTIIATGAATSFLESNHLINYSPDFSRAARTYFEGVSGLSDTVEFHFDAVPLPGYGWVFPVSPTSANIGAGYYSPAGQAPARNSPRQALEEFIAGSQVSRMLENAHMTAPIKGYPLRFDFLAARTAFPGLGLVGEACGLVNPLTGEGIDYALESAEVAAELLIDAHRSSKDTGRAMEKYPEALKSRFLQTFKSLIRVRDWYLKPWMLNRYVATAHHNEDLALLLVNIGLGNIDPMTAFSLKNLLQIALG